MGAFYFTSKGLREDIEKRGLSSRTRVAAAIPLDRRDAADQPSSGNKERPISTSFRTSVAVRS